MPTSLNPQYGLKPDDPNALAGGASIDTTQTGQNQQAQQNPFGTVTPGQISTTAAPAVTPIQNFAFNSKYAAQNQALEQLLADKQLERGNQYAAAQQSYDRNISDAGRTRGKALESLINKFASSGMFGSGIDAKARGDLETEYNRYLGDLALNFANARHGIEGGWANTIRDVNNQRANMWGQQQYEEEQERLRIDRERRDAERAQREAADRQALAAQQAEWNRQALAAAAANRPTYTAPSAGGGYGGGGGGGGRPDQAGQGADPLAWLQYAKQMGGIEPLTSIYNVGLPPEVNTALRSAISTASDTNSPWYMPSAPGGTHQFIWGKPNPNEAFFW